MFTQVIKRDGSLQDYDENKIENAIFAAAKAVGGDDRETAEYLTRKVSEILAEKFADTRPSVENIQDIVEKVLIENGHAKTAKAYILYRKQHQDIREFKNVFLDIEETVDQYIGKFDWRVNENSNMDYSLQGLNNHISSSVTARYWLNKIYPKEVRDAHVNGDFHIHDLGLLSVYCCGWDLKDLLVNGFTGVTGKVASRPPKHFRTALGQIVNFFYTLQGEAAGAQAFSNFDTYLAPFIYFDNLTYGEVKQAMQEFIFNLNVPTRVGFQTPFVNITMDLNPPKILAGEAAIIGGKMTDRTYGEFQPEMDILNSAFAEVMMEGDANGRIFTFPIPTYNITKDFDWDNPVVDKVMEMTAKYGLPYFSNFVNSDMSPDDVRSMCLYPEEHILIRKNDVISLTTIGQLVEEIKGRQLDDEWFEVNTDVQALSLNPESGKIEWANVTKILETYDSGIVTIKAKDGKTMRVSPNHLVAVYTEQGIKAIKAKDVSKNDFLLVMKDATGAINTQKEVDADLAWLIGLFIADGNYLYDSRAASKGRVRGLQFTFNAQETYLIEKTRAVVKRLADYDMKFIKDPRYDNSLRGYIYSCSFGRKFSEEYGVSKYHKLPDWIWSVSTDTISNFVQGFFDGDGYKRGDEIHINDEPLAEELNLLFQFIGISTTYVVRERSQIIRIQHVLGRGANGNKVIMDKLHNLIPKFLITQKFKRGSDGDIKYQSYGNRMVGLSSIDRWGITNESIEWLRKSDFAVVEVADIIKEDLPEKQVFYDVELDKNHYFIHSDGNITHNCCRLRLDNRELKKRGGGLFGANPLTGSIGVVTIDMPRIGYLSQSEDEFFDRLGKLMDIAKTSLEMKREVLEKMTKEGLYPYARFYLRDVYARFGAYWQNHFNTIGLVGMNEALRNFMGTGIATAEGKAFTLKVMDFMKAKMLEYQEESGILYNLEASPAEGATYRLAKKDKELYGDIITCGGDEPYYTNSTQLPVDFTKDIFTALDLQDELQCMYTGGTVLHGFLGERMYDAETCKSLVRKIAENYHLPYYTITPTFSVCSDHGYIAGEHFNCPYCGKEAEVYSRVVGYYRPVKCWNKGKQQEFSDRKEFVV